MMFKNAIVVGSGSIASSVYIPELLSNGYFVYTLDPFMVDGIDYPHIDWIPEDMQFDVAIICCPNEFHKEYAIGLTKHTNKILVEKPGFASSDEWSEVIQQFPDHNISLVKNNLFRPKLDVDVSQLRKIEINWINDNRVPSPGSWFTNKEKAFGGVTHDLFPHLYCFMYTLLPFDSFRDTIPVFEQEQRWDLSTVGSTDYGTVNSSGVYDVCDYATAEYSLDGLTVALTASWKHGYNDQAIHFHYKDGRKESFEFGFCPNEAYASMIESDEQHTEFDLWIHKQLESFND